MLLVIPDVLPPPLLAHMHRQLAQADWHDGRETAGYAAAGQKRNLQLRAQDALAAALGQHVLQALSRHPQFVSFALPQRMLSPMFNCYEGGGQYGWHIDNAIRSDPVTGQRLRADVSTTVFLSDPAEYDGGDLVVQGSYGAQRVKLAAGSAVVYPGTSLHAVEPVTRGQRMACFLWTQSMVADAGRRSMLYELDGCIQQLAGRAESGAADEQIQRLTGIYHNLLRQWAQV